MTSPSVHLPVLCPSTSTEPREHPSLVSILRRLAVSLWVACIVPAALFYVMLVSIGVTTALLAALGWSYGALAWRWALRRPLSGLLVLTVSVLTVRTVFTLMTGDTFFYFFQPVVSDGVLAALFLVSLGTARPVVARLAADFYPMSGDVADRPGVRRLFWRLTLLWGGVGLLKSAVGLWLLETLTMADFVLVKSIAMTGLTVLAVAVTVWASARVLRHESMLQPA